jgi:poly(3-hydroxybutyrate) depolymerase
VKTYLYILTLLTALLLTTLHAAETPAGKSYVYKHSAGQPRDMEIYFPPGHDPATAKVPGVILFHGGSWTGGNLSQFRTAGQYFASRGLVAATVNYRMLTKAETAKLPAGETKKRVCITDAKSAIRWFKQHAGELGIDPQVATSPRWPPPTPVSTIPPTRRISTPPWSPTCGSTPLSRPVTTRTLRWTCCAI